MGIGGTGGVKFIVDRDTAGGLAPFLRRKAIISNVSAVTLGVFRLLVVEYISFNRWSAASLVG